MSLAGESNTAREVAAAFDRFVDAIPDQYTEITALIAELYAVSSALRDMDLLINSRGYARRTTCILDDLDIVRLSLSITLNDALELLGQLDHDGYPPTRATYRRVWDSIYTYFFAESRNSLRARLLRFRNFIEELARTMQRLFLPYSNSFKRPDSLPEFHPTECTWRISD